MVNMHQDMRCVFHPCRLSLNIATTMVGLREEMKRNEAIKKIAIAIFAGSTLALASAGFIATTYVMGSLLTLTVIGIMAFAAIGIMLSAKRFLDTRAVNLKTASWLTDFSLICNGQFDQAFQAFSSRILAVDNYLSGNGRFGSEEGLVYFDPRDDRQFWIERDGYLSKVFGTALMLAALKRDPNSSQIDQSILDFIRKCFRKQRMGLRGGEEQFLNAVQANDDVSQVPVPGKISPAHGFMLDIIVALTNRSRAYYKFDSTGKPALQGEIYSWIPHYINNLKLAKSQLQESGEWTSSDEELIEPMLKAKTTEQIVDAALAISQDQKLALMNRFVSYENFPPGEDLNQFFLEGLKKNA